MSILDYLHTYIHLFCSFLLLKYLIECTNKKESWNVIKFTRTKALKALQISFKSEAWIHMTVQFNSKNNR